MPCQDQRTYLSHLYKLISCFFESEYTRIFQTNEEEEDGSVTVAVVVLSPMYDERATCPNVAVARSGCYS